MDFNAARGIGGGRGSEVVTVRPPSALWRLMLLAIIGFAVFAALTVAVTSNPSLSFDSGAFRVVDDLRAPWLDSVARVLTTLGLIAVVGPVVALAAAILFRRRLGARAIALVAGAALTWSAVWIVKLAVDRPRPPGALVATSGQSFPSGHAANAIGWLALAIALAIVIRARRRRVAAIAAGGLVAVLVGLSRIYLRAHYASDVLAGESLAIAIYALAAIGAVLWVNRGLRRREVHGRAI